MAFKELPFCSCYQWLSCIGIQVDYTSFMFFMQPYLQAMAEPEILFAGFNNKYNFNIFFAIRNNDGLIIYLHYNKKFPTYIVPLTTTSCLHFETFTVVFRYQCKKKMSSYTSLLYPNAKEENLTPETFVNVFCFYHLIIFRVSNG